MPRLERSLRCEAASIGAAAVAALFAVQLYVAFFLPIYTDEIGFKWNYARAFLDGGRMQMLPISCRQDPTTAWPMLWIPARWADALLYEDLSNPTKLRALGFVYAALFLLALVFLVRRACARLQGATAWLVFAFALSYCALGVLPFLLVMNRPESELMWALGWILMLVLLDRRLGSPRWMPVALALLQYYLYAHHPKALFLIPLMVAAWLALEGSVVKKALGLLWTGMLAASLIAFYSQELQCPLDAHVRALLQGNTLGPTHLLADPVSFVSQGLQNLFASVEYVRNVAFRTTYVSNWLPPDLSRADPGIGVVNFAIEAIWLLPVAVTMVALWNLGRRAMGRQLDALGPEDRAPAFLFIGLVISLAATCFMQIEHNDYRSSQVLLMLLLCALLGLMLTRPIAGRFWRIAMTIALLVCIPSQLVFLDSFARYTLTTWKRPGPTVGQPVSVSHVGYGSIRSRIAQLAEKCGISEERPPPHLVVDDSTYPVFWRSKLPYHLLYLGPGWGDGIPNLKAFLRERRFGGVVARCDRMPPQLRPLATAENGICCVSAER